MEFNYPHILLVVSVLSVPKNIRPGFIGDFRRLRLPQGMCAALKAEGVIFLS